MCAKPWQRWRTDGNIFTVSGCTPVGAQQQQPMNIDASRQHSFCLGLSTLTCHGLIACHSVCLPCHAMLSLLWPSFLTENCIAQRSPIVRPKPIPGAPVILARLSYARDLCCLPSFFFSAPLFPSFSIPFLGCLHPSPLSQRSLCHLRHGPTLRLSWNAGWCVCPRARRRLLKGATPALDEFQAL